MSILPFDQAGSIKALLERSDDVIRRGDEAIKKSSELSASVAKAIRRYDRFFNGREFQLLGNEEQLRLDREDNFERLRVGQEPNA